jgi:hypothetical protein
MKCKCKVWRQSWKEIVTLPTVYVSVVLDDNYIFWNRLVDDASMISPYLILSTIDMLKSERFEEISILWCQSLYSYFAKPSNNHRGLMRKIPVDTQPFYVDPVISC